MPRILVVDDDPVVQKTFRRFLALEGYDVVLADSVTHAIEILRGFTVDTVLTDIEMPGEDGLVLVPHCRDQYPTVPVVIVTGRPDAAHAIAALRTGAFDFVAKPIGRELLLVTVARAVTTGRTLAEKQRLEEENREQREKLERASLEVERELKRRTRELRETERNLAQAEKLAALGQLAAGIAHEINNPASFITTSLNQLAWLMSDAGRANPDWMTEARQVVAEGLDGASRVATICRDLRDFAHADSAEMVEADVNRCVEQAITIANNELKQKAKLNTRLATLPTVRCHPGKLTQIFINLLTNAAHSIERFGSIEIASEALDDKVVVRIKDNGQGIPRENIDKVFEPFFTTKEIGRGTGLGLYLSKEIVERHGGTIGIESDVGQGTTVTVALPRS